jgi:hypothetical protein
MIALLFSFNFLKTTIKMLKVNLKKNGRGGLLCLMMNDDDDKIFQATMTMTTHVFFYMRSFLGFQ